MKVNISDKLSKAYVKATDWTQADVLFLLVLILRRIQKSWLSWDEESGENWAKIILYDEIIAYINIELPILMIKSSIFSKNILGQIDNKIEIIQFLSSENNEFTVNKETFLKVFKENEWRDEICNAGSFSAQELYFLTAT